MSLSRPSMLAVILAGSLLSGCLAKTAVSVATAPLRVAGRAADLATTSQSEADENRGRAMRHRDEKRRKLEKKHRRALADCNKGKREACDDAARINGQIARLQER
jgi:hypothetical protein